MGIENSMLVFEDSENPWEYQVTYDNDYFDEDEEE